MKLSKRIQSWIKREVARAGKRGVVLGLSGGVDSAVVAVLSKRALGAQKVLGLILPCHSMPDDEKSAKQLAAKFGIRTVTVPLGGVFDSFKTILPNAGSIAFANLKPRLRMCALYHYAQKLDYIVAGTGNRSEIEVGYFTKYGDGGVDILPIGGLLKSEVRALARELDIPGNIIEKPPSAGLWRGQTDEGEMGIAYEDLDRILNALKRGRSGNADRPKLNKVKNLINKSGHKRRNIPVFKV
ncbi:MAG: NAD+ synthase [Candidatus Omnitrophota bacterium]